MCNKAADVFLPTLKVLPDCLKENTFFKWHVSIILWSFQVNWLVQN